jgi:hypothetical protein
VPKYSPYYYTAINPRKRERKKNRTMKLNLMIVTILAFVLSACGAKATPTPDVMATANAAASTMIAETQAAMPTEPPVPPTEIPTETPQPTPTIPPLPTVPVLASPTRVPVTGGGECSGVISTSKGESTATIVINNNTKVLLGVSLYLNKNSFGDCGFWSSPAGIPASSSVTISNFPASNSCYHVTAWTLAGKPIFKTSNDFCIGFNVTQSRLNVTTTGISVP